MDFTDKERKILEIVQNDIPNSSEPFADIAKLAECSEDDVISLLKKLKDSGVIRRFGASLTHQKTKWDHNVMVAWMVDDANMDYVGQCASEHPNVSHCYFRPQVMEDFPYTLFTMIHGRTDEECERAIADLQKINGMGEFARLSTKKELKKCSPIYF